MARTGRSGLQPHRDRHRLAQAGAYLTNWIAVGAELKRDEDNPRTDPMNEVFGAHMALYDFLGDSATADRTST